MNGLLERLLGSSVWIKALCWHYFTRAMSIGHTFLIAGVFGHVLGLLAYLFSTTAANMATYLCLIGIFLILAQRDFNPKFSAVFFSQRDNDDMFDFAHDDDGPGKGAGDPRRAARRQRRRGETRRATSSSVGLSGAPGARGGGDSQSPPQREARAATSGGVDGGGGIENKAGGGAGDGDGDGDGDTDGRTAWWHRPPARRAARTPRARTPTSPA